MPKITKRVVDAAKSPAKGQVFIRDSELLGFALRLTKSSKAFILEKRVRGRMRRITIGAYGPFTVEQARKQAVELAGRIAKGEDPAQERRDAHAEPTFGNLTALYVERHGPKKRTIAIDQSVLKRYVDDWRTWRLSAITPNEVARRHSKVGETAPYAANRLVALLRKMFNLARGWGLSRDENPAEGLQFFPERKRSRFVEPAEFPRFFQALKHEPDPYIKTALLVSLFTGARIGETLAAKWDDVDLDRAVWRLPQTKADREHLLPLPGPVLQALRALKRLHGNPHVFPSHGKSGHLTDLSRAWARICERAKIRDLRIHDVRRTLGSWLAIAGASLPMIGKILNHSQPSTTAIYARLHLDPLREALETNAQKMLVVAKRKGAR